MSHVTASFQLFSIDGLQIAFSLVGETDSPAAWVDSQIAQLYKAGYRTEPVEGDLRSQIIPITGYVRTQIEELNTKALKPALAMFSPWGDYAAITIYPEAMGSLPFQPTGKVWDGGAFDRELVVKRGYLTPCNIKIQKEPVLDYEGKPKLTEKGNTKWRFVKVVEIDGKAIDSTEPTHPVPQASKPQAAEPSANGHAPQTNGTQPKPAQPAPQTSSAAPVDKKLEAKKVVIRRFVPTAKATYGDVAWTPALLKISCEITGREITGLTQLDMAELSKLEALINLDAAGINEYQDATAWYEALPVLLSVFNTESVYTLTLDQIKKLHKDLTVERIAVDGGEDIPF